MKDLNENENTNTNLWNTMKEVVKEKILALSTLIRKLENSHTKKIKNALRLQKKNKEEAKNSQEEQTAGNRQTQG